MQGFFGKPVDNLFAEPLIARWIRINVPGWKDAVVVSKNAGGSKRVTSLADTLKLNFGIVTTDRRRPKVHVTMSDSTIFFDSIEKDDMLSRLRDQGVAREEVESAIQDNVSPSADTLRPETPPAARRPSELEAAESTSDGRALDVITGRLVQGHLVDDDYPSPALSSVLTPVPMMSTENGIEHHDHTVDPMAASVISAASSLQPDHALGGTYDAVESDDEEAQALCSNEEERTITLVGDVKDKTVFIVDDMIDRSGSWIAAAETVVKKGGAKKVYCIATHGLFGDDSLEEMEASNVIDHIVVTNSFPIPIDKSRRSKKLVVIDVSTLLSEAIRRHHYGER
jgi:ribose-phosphate pyrophosphokinase